MGRLFGEVTISQSPIGPDAEIPDAKPFFILELGKLPILSLFGQPANAATSHAFQKALCMLMRRLTPAGSRASLSPRR